MSAVQFEVPAVIPADPQANIADLLVERVKAVEDDAKEARSAAGTKHEANAARIAAVERDSAVHAVSMANLSNQIAAIGSAIQRLEDRVAQVPNDLREILASSKR